MKYQDKTHFLRLLSTHDTLDLTVDRFAKRTNYTIGHLLIYGEVFSDTLEDTDRGLSQHMSTEQIAKVKVYGKTAIPIGTYRVSVVMWQKYKINVPYLAGVPGYTGILIHNGATEADTLGCILVGENREKGRLTNGKVYMTSLTEICQQAIRAGKPIRITIK